MPEGDDTRGPSRVRSTPKSAASESGAGAPWRPARGPADGSISTAGGSKQWRAPTGKSVTLTRPSGAPRTHPASASTGRSVCGRMQRLRFDQRSTDVSSPHPDSLPISLIFRRGFRNPHERALGDAKSTFVQLSSEDTVFTGSERLRDLVALTSVCRVIRLRPVCHRATREQPHWARAEERRFACRKLLRRLHPLTHMDGTPQDNGVVFVDRLDMLHRHYGNFHPAGRKLGADRFRYFVC